MSYQTRRGFINKIMGAGLGMSVLSLSSFTLKGKKKLNHLESRLSVIDEVDICVLGGSCTGVFAAVRAARLGAKVAIVEKQNAFGGVATNAFVNIWHSLLNTEFDKEIIAGLTAEVIDRLTLRDAIVKSSNSPSAGVAFNSQELKIELD